MQSTSNRRTTRNLLRFFSCLELIPIIDLGCGRGRMLRVYLGMSLLLKVLLMLLFAVALHLILRS